MKLLGHFLAYLLMTTIFMVGFAGIGIGLTAVVSFITWTLPTAAQLASINWWAIIRIMFSVASLFGIWFACDKEGKEFANEFVKGFNKGYKK